MNAGKAIFAAALAAFFAATAGAEESRLVRFGLITDTHVCDKADQSATVAAVAGPRFFTGGLAKLEAFSTDMNAADADFIAELGDLTDNPADSGLSYEARKATVLGFLGAAEAKLALFKGPRYHVFGNHDTDQLAKEEVSSKAANTGIKRGTGRYYFSFDRGRVHFVVLDAGYKADGAAYSGVPDSAGSGYVWSDANIPADELAWLAADLAATRKPVVVLSHQLLNPQELVDPAFDPAHSVKNAAEVRAVMEKSGKVVAVFAGHYHDGGYQFLNGIHYVTLQASAAYGADAAEHGQYATVSIYGKGKDYTIAVGGHGLQRSYVLSASIR